MEHPYQAVIDAVNSVLCDEGMTVYTVGVIDRLVMYGMTPAVADAVPIAYAMLKAREHLLNFTNQKDIPEGLKHTFTGMCCGEYLYMQYSTGKLSIEGLDLTAIVKSVSEGDTSVSFAEGGTDSAKISGLISSLRNGEGGDLICYRKLRW